ncbi:MAG: hypothetical protein H0X14_00325 [Acidobacteria bacterium]|nr:hypothetical protein [Acidobacteriota bacterium]
MSEKALQLPARVRVPSAWSAISTSMRDAGPLAVAVARRSSIASASPELA